MKNNNVLFLFLIGGGCFNLGLVQAYAENLPSIGSIIQPVQPSTEYRNLIRESLAQKPAIVETPENISLPSEVDEVGMVFLKKINFDHNLKQIDLVALEKISEPYLNKKVKLSELKQMSYQIQQWLYQKYGLVKVKVWIPLQEIKNQTLDIEIHQGSAADILVVQDLKDSVQEHNLIQLAAQFLKKDDPLTQPILEEIAYRAIDYLNQPVTIILMPTKEVGKYNVVLDTQAKPRISGSVSIDNTGSRFTDTWRDNTILNIANLWGTAGDLYLSGQVWNEHQKSWYTRYEQPTIQGWRFGIDAQYADYELCCDFSALNSSGLSWSVNADVSKTLVRSRNLSSWLIASASYWNGQNKFSSEKISDRNIQTVDLTGRMIWSNRADHYLSAGLTAGIADLSAVVTDAEQDRHSAKIDGSFYKFKAYYGISYPLNAKSSLFWTNQAQMANKNLDSSQKMSVGGLSGVRAYPYGEALSDQAFTSQLEYRYQINPYVQAKAFYDFGYAYRNVDPWENLNTKNHYDLHGTGIGLVWCPLDILSLTLLSTAKLAQNPGADALGRDHDAKDSDFRTWFIATWTF